MKKRTIIGGVVATALVASIGVAWAAVLGVLNIPDVVTGSVQGTGAASCQVDPVEFTIPEPTFSVSALDYVVDKIEYSGINTACIQAGNTDLLLQLTQGYSNLVSGSVEDMTSDTGFINLAAAVPYSDVVTAKFNYLVRG